MFNACTAELIKMATENRFIDCESPHAVHVELITKLCCGYLNVESHLTEFRLRCRIYLTTPDEKRLSFPSDIIDKLEAKGTIRVGDYGKLKHLVRDIDVDIAALIEEAEERIKSLEGQTGSPSPKRLKIDTKVDEQSISHLRQRLIKINNNMTKIIPLSPLLERGEDELPIEQLYAHVVINEDPMYKEKGHDSSHSTKVVTDPDDMFKKDGEAVEKIYMIGDAGRGKTTYCLWLLKNWCNALQKDGSDSEELDKWERKLKEFDFCFLIQLGDFQDIQTNVASVIDMICQVVFESKTDHHATIRHVLSSNQYRSLIIIDGLDEWNPNEETRKYLIHDRMPKLNVSSTVSCFIAMRPWVLTTFSKVVKNSDRVLEIFGLNEAGIENVIQNVLLNRYKLKDYPIKYKGECRKIVQHFSEKELESFMQIPLLTVVCVQMLYEKKQLGDSMTSFYAEMLNMLIERANEKHKILEIGPDTTLGCKLPEILSKYKAIKKCTSVLLKLGKVAYAGVLSNETNITLEKEGLEEQISEREFLLNVGFISQKEASSRNIKKVSIHFFHKSIQEFLAAVHIITNKEVGDSFCERLSSVEVIMELSNVIMFICGMCPSLGSDISEHVVSVTDSDYDICRHRESPIIHCIDTTEKLYRLQLSWYRELQGKQTDRPATCYISDVLIYKDNDKETVRLNKEVLSDTDGDIRSLLYCYEREHDTYSTVINEFLSNKYNNTWSLVMVYIDGNYSLSISTICIPTLQTLHLLNVKIDNTRLDGNGSPPLLENMTSLQNLEMESVDLGARGLDLSGLYSLRDLKLSCMTLGERGLDLSNLDSLQDLELWDLNLDDRGLNLSNTSLERLYLYCITFGDRGLVLSDKTSLYELSLSHMTLGEGELDISYMTSLKKLYLEVVDLIDGELDLSNMTSLDVLDLSYMTLGEEGLNLSGMTSLRRLTLTNVNLGDGGLDLSGATSLRELRLSEVILGDGGLDLSDVASLRELRFESIDLGDRGLDLSANMVHIANVWLKSVNMSAEQWEQFILSVLVIQHEFNLEVDDIGIDEESKTRIISSPHFNVTRDGVDEYASMTNMDNDHIPIYSTKSIIQKIRNRRHTKSG